LVIVALVSQWKQVLGLLKGPFTDKGSHRRGGFKKKREFSWNHRF